MAIDPAHRVCLAPVLLAAMLTLSAPARAQRSDTVHFPAGASHTTLKGKVRGHDYRDYVLGARSGQTMSASIKATGGNGNGTVYFNVLPPGSETALFVGSMSADGRASLKLPADGAYRIRVYLMGNDKDARKIVGYALQVSVQ